MSSEEATRADRGYGYFPFPRQNIHVERMTMKKAILLLAVLMVLLAESSVDARFNYTWRDADGVLNITDYPPPEDAEVIDVRVIPFPDEKQITPEVKQPEVQQEQDQTRNRLLAEAASLRNEEATLRQEAAELIDEAQELRRLAKKQGNKRRYRLRAAKKEKEAEELLNRADILGAKAQTLEQQASRLK